MVLRAHGKRWLRVGGILIAGLIIFILMAVNHRKPPAMTISLTSPPRLEAEPEVFYVYLPESATYTQKTQSCYVAEIEMKNLGPGAVLLAYRGGVGLEVQTEDSTEWQATTAHPFGTRFPVLLENDSIQYPIEIPAEAARWRVTASYHRWQRTSRYLNLVLGYFLGIGLRVGDQKEYETKSEVWPLSPLPASAEAKIE